MPKAAPLNHDLLRSIFLYDPQTGELHPKTTATRLARRTDKRQWEIGPYRYSLHRLVWAYHHPENPNPKYVGFKNYAPTDTGANRTCIENLVAKDVHPRWEGHVKQVRAKLDKHGHIVVAGAAPRTSASPPLQAIARIPVFVRPPAPTIDTSFVDEFDRGDFGARPGDTFDANDYDYQ